MRLIVSAAVALMIAVSGFLLAPAARASGLPACTSRGQFLLYDLDLAWMPTVGYQSTDNDCLLGLGNSSDAVVVLQTDLDACYPGTSRLTVDGHFGPLTMAALQAAQRSAGITPDGVYGPVTRDHILWTAGTRCSIDI